LRAKTPSFSAVKAVNIKVLSLLLLVLKYLAGIITAVVPAASSLAPS